MSVALYNISGSKCFAENYDVAKNAIVTIDGTSALPKGLYIISATSDKGTKAWKLLKR